MRRESRAAARERLTAISRLLRERYPTAECALRYEGDPWRLLVMGRLSAQCTDARVNEVAVPLFARYPTAAAMAAADPRELEALVRPCGLFRTKARDLILASRRLTEVYGGRLPDSMEELLTLPGVGRKIANLLLGDIFGRSCVVADTHMIRLSGRWGFTPEDKRDPLLVERTLTPLLSEENASELCHRAVLFGREVCTARSPDCRHCELCRAGLCRFSERSRYE
ncbi:MAG: endonuclease III [Clostridia bacterium]|nr:endonuclease III [Clostridia bacterium]